MRVQVWSGGPASHLTVECSFVSCLQSQAPLPLTQQRGLAASGRAHDGLHGGNSGASMQRLSSRLPMQPVFLPL